MIDPIDDCNDATRALNVIAAVRRAPGMTAAQIVTFLNSTLMPDDPLDNISAFSLLYVTTGIAKAGALLVNTAGAYTLASSNYVVRSGDTNIVQGGATAVPGSTW